MSSIPLHVMTQGYTKLFSTILGSSVWFESDPIRILWITMMAMADREGKVRASVPGLAHYARIGVEECEEGLRRFMAPDAYSSNKEFEGRRIEEVPGGWRLLNHKRYMEMMSVEQRRDYNRQKQAEYRAKAKENRQGMVAAEIIREQEQVGREIDKSY